MKASLRCLQSVQRLSLRPKSTSFVGLGRMGSEMAYNLFSKQFAKKPDSHFVNFTAAFPGSNIEIVATPEEATLASEWIITMLPSSAQVQTVYSGAIIPTLRSLPADLARKTFCIDSTTLDVDVSRKVAEDVIAIGASMVDAPVSGGVTGAKAGTLAFLVGGTEASFQAAHPVLSMMGQRIVHCGPAGAGLGAKICNNLILGVQQIVVAEAMILGQKLGLDPAVLSSVIGSSTGNCWSISVNNPVRSALLDKSPPCERDYEGGFATALMEKDMGLASDLAKKTETKLVLGDAARGLYSRMMEQQPELARKDFSSVYRFLNRRSD
ncbi:NAD dependent epimerase dehydratase family protein [Mycena sanguinolenta]|uniref:3-hydroxyisobutyrate dehydrogenase n=1 Tax=Mycena sanguinolenta TaxID=230812 RepID=A0A8H7D5C0_9AGAR|nr:NAD dependent epimerase dehydratase family protein [Mycena sanguinolenta]